MLKQGLCPGRLVDPPGATPQVEANSETYISSFLMSHIDYNPMYPIKKP